MAEVALQTPFGRVALACASGTPGAVGPVAPDLPEGLAVDGCLRGVLHLALNAGETAEVILAGPDARPAPSEMLAAFTLDRPGLSAAFGMRDAEWLAGRWGLRQTGFAARPGGLTLWLRAEAPVVAALRFAAAWTHAPASEEAAFAPLFAIEAALPFRGD